MVKCEILYIDLHGKDSGSVHSVAMENTIDEAEKYMQDCAEAYRKCMEMHHVSDIFLYGIQGTSPIEVKCDGEAVRIYFINIVNC